MPQGSPINGIDTDSRAAVQISTKFGTMKVEWQGDALCRLHWMVDPVEAQELPSWERFLTRASETQSRLIEDLIAYTEGEAISFHDIPVMFTGGTSFRQRIWRACREIPYGETVTYGTLARMAGRPGAARAVGSAMANNQIPLVIPCHRVVAAGNKLGGFSSPQGTLLKKRLLQMENLGRIEWEGRRMARPLTAHHQAEVL